MLVLPDKPIEELDQIHPTECFIREREVKNNTIQQVEKEVPKDTGDRHDKQ